MKFCASCLLALLTFVLLVGGCSDDDGCETPGVLEQYCDDSKCDCVSSSISVVAYIDLISLPSTNLVSSPDNYMNGNDMAPLVCLEGGAEVPEGSYSPDTWDRLDDSPIKAVVSDAYIRKVMQPGNGVQIPTWQIEIQSAEQVNYYQVLDDGTEVLISGKE